MKYGEFNINRAEGLILCSNLRLGEKFYAKGHALTQEDIIVFKMFDIRFVFGVMFEEGDVDYKVAGNQIAAQICGPGLGYVTENDGICRIVAAKDGVFLADENRLDKFNHFNEHFIINTIAPHTFVQKGDVICELEVVPPLVTEAEVDDMIFRLSGNANLLQLADIMPKSAVLVYSHLLNDSAENTKFTTAVMKLVTNLSGLGIEFKQEISSQYDSEKLADSLFDAFSTGAEAVFVFSPLRGASRQDIITTALQHAADEVVNYTVPLVGASDLLIAQKGQTKIIVVPSAYDEIETSAVDSLIKHAIFTEYLSEASFSRKRSGHLNDIVTISEELSGKLIMPSGKGKKNDKADIGIIILAAGQGRRSGANKLMIEGKDGLPLFMHAVNAAITSNAKPVFVVTGYRHEELEEWLEKLDVNVLYNPSFASGIKTSIDMGLKSVPSSCDGAILLPADMPNITATDLNKLINKFDKKENRQLCLLTHKKIKHNPVLWSKSLYDKADLVPENSAFRVVFAEHADYTNVVEIKDKNKLLDVTYSNDVKEYASN